MPSRRSIAKLLAGALVSLLCAVSAAARADDAPVEVTCLERAEGQAALQEQERERLCLGASGLAPIECFRDAVDQAALDKPEAIDLCRCATSVEPVRCFRAALRTRPDEPLWAVRQCSPIAAQNLTADCRAVVPTDPGLR